MSSRAIAATLVLVTLAAWSQLAADPRRAQRAAAETVAVHMSPAENLERIDIATIDTARREIDFAAFVLTDHPVIEALARAADRDVAVRILLDRSQHRDEAPPLQALPGYPGMIVGLEKGAVA